MTSFLYHWRSVALVWMSKLNFVSYGPLIGTDLFKKRKKNSSFWDLIAQKLNSPEAIEYCNSPYTMRI